MGWPPRAAPGGGGKKAPESGSTPRGISLYIIVTWKWRKTRTGERRSGIETNFEFVGEEGSKNLTPIARRRVTITAVPFVCIVNKRNKTLSLGLEPRAFASQPSNSIHSAVGRLVRQAGKQRATIALRQHYNLLHNNLIQVSHGFRT